MVILCRKQIVGLQRNGMGYSAPLPEHASLAILIEAFIDHLLLYHFIDCDAPSGQGDLDLSNKHDHSPYGALKIGPLVRRWIRSVLSHSGCFNHCITFDT